MQSLGDENIAKPILIKDDNLIIKPNEEPVPEPVLINDTNLMIQKRLSYNGCRYGVVFLRLKFRVRFYNSGDIPFPCYSTPNV
jgi:hypothetical protein